jgi:hypothetical protein
LFFDLLGRNFSSQIFYRHPKLWWLFIQQQRYPLTS